MRTMERVLYPDTETVTALLGVWEASVRATHTFLPEKEIHALRTIVQNAFMNIDHLYRTKDGSAVVAFMGVRDSKIEMLFVSPNDRGKGVGKDLVTFARSALKANSVDVYEQNAQAVGFFEHLGFTVVTHSELNIQGMSYAVLHMYAIS